jgi:hypothetical protein
MKVEQTAVNEYLASLCFTGNRDSNDPVCNQNRDFKEHEPR